MPAFANLTLADGQASPANHTFYASHEEPSGVWNHVENAAANAIGYFYLKWSVKTPPIGGKVSTQDRVYRVKQTVSCPTLESTSAATGSGIPPAPTVAYTCVSNVEYVLPERSTLQNRKDINAYTKNGLAHASWTAQSEQLLPIT